ncbi:KilA-N domain-containing protein, partial [Thiovulum sp. ES]
TEKNYSVQIGHLSKVGKLNDVLEIGNKYRKEKGLREIEMREWLRKEATWEFIIEVERKYGTSFQTPDSGVCLSNHKNKETGQIDFALLVKQFSVIKSQRGGKPENRGYWANLYIMLDLASFLDPVLKLEMYEVFINQKILFWRDVGGDNFKEFNKIVDTLPDRKEKNNTGIYVSMSKRIRQKLSILSTKGYNEKEHDSLVQENRAEWLKTLGFAINVGWIKSFDELKNAFDKLELIEK